MRQTQLYVNEHADELNREILGGLPDLAVRRPRIVWVSPLRQKGYGEYRDEAFLHALGFPDVAADLGKWWPHGGPRWDALARLEFEEGEPGILLVESKSYPDEMYDKAGCDAWSETSLSMIAAALAETQNWLDVDKPVESWMRPLYQTANRLATLKFLMDRMNGRAWLVHLCFLDDPTHPMRIRTTKSEWQQALVEASAVLGIERAIPHYAHVFVEGLPGPGPGGSARVASGSGAAT
jgi:hypothetical protein